MTQNRRPGKLLQSSVDVVLWAIAQEQPITPASIRDRWHVDRATAYRWWHLLESARVRAQLMVIPRARRYRTPVVDQAEVRPQ